jgi:hypothetical protein
MAAMHIKDHMHELHARLAEHHAKVARHHSTMAKHHKELAANAEGDAADTHEAIGDEHSAMAEHHASEGEFHLSCCKALAAAQKTMGMGNDPADALVPDFVSAIAPEIPMNVRAIPRAGQREFEKADAVPQELEKIVSFD